MSTITFSKQDSPELFSEYKTEYIQLATGPLDGMWLCGFVPLAQHYGIRCDQQLIGYFCVNESGNILQYFVRQDERHRASDIFRSILQTNSIDSGRIQGAFVSTAEPTFLSVCLDHFAEFRVNAITYQLDPTSVLAKTENSQTIESITAAQLDIAVDFAVASIGVNDGWVRGYFANLIERQELYGWWEAGQLLATGERREYDEYQTDYCDVGVIVAIPARGKGIATQVLRQLVALNQSKNLQSICSTEASNIAAQTAITRAGFAPSNRIVQFSRESNS